MGWDNAGPLLHDRDYPMSETSTTTYRTWMCVVCGFLPRGRRHPRRRHRPGTRWQDVPDTWTCPDCGVTKEDFEMVEID